MAEYPRFIGKVMEDTELVLAVKGTKGGMGNSNAFFKNKQSTISAIPKQKTIGKDIQFYSFCM